MRRHRSYPLHRLFVMNPNPLTWFGSQNTAKSTTFSTTVKASKDPELDGRFGSVTGTSRTTMLLGNHRESELSVATVSERGAVAFPFPHQSPLPGGGVDLAHLDKHFPKDNQTHLEAS